MTINHIDQLAQWYADAEQITDTNLPRIGDTLILPSNTGGFSIELERDGWTPDIVMTGEPIRILARAPKPKPAWHDAVAVIAWTDLAERQVWERDGGGTYCGTAGDVADDYELHDVTPLIEAKVTGEMVERARQRADSLAAAFIYSASEWHMREVLTAALGLETE